MNLLSPTLKAKIEEHPTDTFIRSDNKDYNTYLKFIYKDNIEIPNIFDGREVWKGLLIPVEDQGKCGSCWAFATTSCLSDRFNIQSMGLIHVNLSVAKVILCNFQGKELNIKHPEKNINAYNEIEYDSIKKGSCFGNTLYDAWRYLFLLGTTTNECISYNKKYGSFNQLNSLKSFTDVSKMPICSEVSGLMGDMCSNFTFNTYTSEETGTPARFYRALHFYAVAGVEKDGGSEKNIRQNIYKRGPVTSGMKMYSDFYTFDSKNSIYEWDGISPHLGGHAIEIVGWGKEGIKDYWIIKNSWGENWGDKGYFKMIRGTNNCEIEENIITGIPDFFYPLTVNYSSIIKNPDLQNYYGESDQSILDRIEINTNISKVYGGIDPETGYSRRTKAVMPWVNWEKPVKLSDLPDYSKWIAGVDASEFNRTKYQTMIQAKYINKREGSLSLYIVIFLLGILLIILIIIIIFKLIHHPNNLMEGYQ